jgi:hypothetical protein
LLDLCACQMQRFAEVQISPCKASFNQSELLRWQRSEDAVPDRLLVHR